MDNNFDSLRKLIEHIKTIRFFERLFKWKKVTEQLTDAVVDLQKFTSNTDNLNEKIAELKSINSGLKKDIELANTTIINQTKDISYYSSTIQEQTGKLSELTAALSSRDTTIDNDKKRIIQLEKANELLNQKNEQLTYENNKYSQEEATRNEALTKITERKNQLEKANELITQKNEQLTYENNKFTQEEATRNEAITKITERKNQLEKVNELIIQKNEQLTTDNKKYSQEEATAKEALINTNKRKNELEVETEGLRINLSNLQIEYNSIKQKNTQLITEEEGRRTRYESDVATLTSIREQIQQERALEIETRNNTEIERIVNLKETWNLHQDNVKSIIKNISNKHVIEYIDKFPLKGDPDNTLKICDEFVIFDAKSPGTDDLTNFPNYLKDQAEKAKKYAKQEGVKKDIFFVVPTNTLERLNQFVFNLGDYDVFIISVDSLEQIILGLKKIESYEFAEKLSPEERDNICRVLGKFAHLTKRRIQIDSFFAKQFIELAYKSETDLPKEFLEKVIEFEKSEKLNPPVERRAKVINTKELDRDTNKLKIEAAAKGIFIDEGKISDGLNDLQLYKNEVDE